MLNTKNFYVDLNNLIFNYQNVSIADFSLFIDNNIINCKNTIVITFFLVLKSNRNFYHLVLDKLDFNIQPEDYLLQLQLLKTFQNFQTEFSNNLNTSLLESGLDFNNSSIQQVFFDLCLLFDGDNILFYTKTTNVHNIILSSVPMDKFNLIKKNITKKQKKQLFIACVNHFRNNSIFILNDLFKIDPRLFSQKFILNHLNIFSQLNNEIKTYIINFLFSLPANQAFKTGTQLAYTQFSDEILIDFFNNLYLKNSELFFLFSSGFISNPQQHKPFIISYLIKKNNFIRLNKRLTIKDTSKNKTIKI